MPSLSRPPEYGSPEWRALPKDDPRRKEAVLHAADCWRLLMASPHVSQLLGEWVEFVYRREAREASWAISEAVDWRSVASAPTYMEVRRRRAAPAWTVPCLAQGIAGCKTVRTIDHPPTADDLVCDLCRPAAFSAAA